MNDLREKMETSLRVFLINTAGQYAPQLKLEFLPDDDQALAYTNYETAFICSANHEIFTTWPIAAKYNYQFRKGLAIHEGGHPLYTDFKKIAAWFDKSKNRYDLLSECKASETQEKVAAAVDADSAIIRAATEKVFVSMFFEMINTVEDGHLEKRILAECNDNNVLGPLRFMRLVFQKELVRQLKTLTSFHDRVQNETLQIALYDKVQAEPGYDYALKGKLDFVEYILASVNAKAPAPRFENARLAFVSYMAIIGMNKNPDVVQRIVFLVQMKLLQQQLQKSASEKDKSEEDDATEEAGSGGLPGSGKPKSKDADEDPSSDEESSEKESDDELAFDGDPEESEAGDDDESTGGTSSDESDPDKRSPKKGKSGKPKTEDDASGSPAAVDQENLEYENPVPRSKRQQDAAEKNVDNDPFVETPQQKDPESFFEQIDGTLTEEEVLKAMAEKEKKKSEREVLVAESQLVIIPQSDGTSIIPPNAYDMESVKANLYASFKATKQSSARPDGHAGSIKAAVSVKETASMTNARSIASTITSQLESALSMLANIECMGGMYTGCGLDMESVVSPIPGGVFYDATLPLESLDTCVTILVDCSASMCYRSAGVSRTSAAIQASLVMYNICKSLQIPITVGGFNNSYYHCVDASIQDDGYGEARIAALSPSGGTYEAPFLLWQGNRLLSRKEERKLLFIISDGGPSESFAPAELCAIARYLESSGIELIIASIGEDKKTLKTIYGDGRYLDISDPMVMVRELPEVLLESIRNKL